MGADPSGGLLARRSDQRRDDAATGDGSRARVREDSLVLAAGEPDPDAIEPSVAGQPLDDRAGHRLRGIGRREQPADGELPGRLDGATLGLGGALAPESGQAPDGDRHDQDEDEVEQLARVGNHERQARLGEQDVVDEERDDGRAERGGRSGHGSDDDDDDEIDRRGIGDPGPLLEDGDHDRSDGDRPDGERDDGRRDAGRPQRCQPLDHAGLHRGDGTSGRVGGTKRQVGTAGYTKVRLGATPTPLIRSATQRAGPYP